MTETITADWLRIWTHDFDEEADCMIQDNKEILSVKGAKGELILSREKVNDKADLRKAAYLKINSICDLTWCIVAAGIWCSY